MEFILYHFGIHPVHAFIFILEWFRNFSTQNIKYSDTCIYTYFGIIPGKSLENSTKILGSNGRISEELLRNSYRNVGEFWRNYGGILEEFRGNTGKTSGKFRGKFGEFWRIPGEF